MFRNYLTAALRNLVRNRLYAAINIAGLALGFIAAIFASLFVRNELTYEHWLPHHERIYLVASTVAGFRGVPAATRRDTYRDVGAWMNADFPEVELSARTRGYFEPIMQRGEIRDIERQVESVDPKFFSIFQLPVVAGVLPSLFDRPDEIVITHALARKYFGRDDPIGEIVDMDGRALRVVAVIADWPANTTFSTQAFASSSAANAPLARFDEQTFTANSEPYWTLVTTYVRLKDGADVERLRAGLNDFVERRIPKNVIGEMTLHLLPISSLHLSPMDAGGTREGALALLYGLSIIGILVLLAACINFVNLATARATRRAVEVGVRKVSGAMQRQLIVQFVGESIVTVGIAFVCALAVAQLLLPPFQALIGRPIPLHLAAEPAFALGLVAAALAVGVAAGAYPAFVLARFRPAIVLKAITSVRGFGSYALRRILAVTQMAILIGLVAGTIVIYRQTLFLMNEGLRFDKDQVLLLPRACTAAMKAEIQSLPGVATAACSWGPADTGGYRSIAVRPDGLEVRDLAMNPVDVGFFEVYGVAPLAGRLFHADRDKDVASGDMTNPSVVVTEAAARKLGFTSNAQAIGQVIDWRRMIPSRHEALDTRPLLPSEIIGVVPDFTLSPQRAVRPMIYYADMAMSAPRTGYDVSDAQTLNVKLRGQDLPETLAAIDQVWDRLGDPRKPNQRIFIDQRIQSDYRDQIRQSRLFMIFAVASVLMAALGLFGLATFTAEQRIKEIGIRKAMGATNSDVVFLLLWQFIKPVIWAIALALPIAAVTMQFWLERFAAHIALQPWMFFAPSALAIAVTIFTVFGHALLVARAKPVAALRYE